MRGISWETLQHAAGAADDVPAALVSLRAEDEDERDFAVSWFVETLFEDASGSACVHTATVPVARALAAFCAEDHEGGSLEETQAEVAEILGELHARFANVPGAEELLRVLAPFAAS